MKTQDEWASEYERQRKLPRGERKLIHHDGSYIEAIQLDAFKAGAEWAAGLIEDRHGIGKVASVSILSASSRLTKIPK